MGDEASTILPSYYDSPVTGLKVCEVIEDWTRELSGYKAFCLGNIIKYALRYSRKNGAEDVQKLITYVEFLPAHIYSADRLAEMAPVRTQYRIGDVAVAFGGSFGDITEQTLFVNLLDSIYSYVRLNTTLARTCIKRDAQDLLTYLHDRDALAVGNE